MVIIKEFLPNPAGKDTEGEWLKLFNDSDVGVDLTGWQIKDASGKAFIFSGIGGDKIIASGETLVLDYKTTKISLNNNGETIFLYDKAGALMDKAEYKGNAGDGKVYVRAEGGNFVVAGASSSNGNKSDSGLANISASMADISAPSRQSSPEQIIINNNSPILNISIGLFVALALAALFILISKKIDLFSD